MTARLQSLFMFFDYEALRKRTQGFVVVTGFVYLKVAQPAAIMIFLYHISNERGPLT